MNSPELKANPVPSSSTTAPAQKSAAKHDIQGESKNLGGHVKGAANSAGRLVKDSFDYVSASGKRAWTAVGNRAPGAAGHAAGFGVGLSTKLKTESWTKPLVNSTYAGYAAAAGIGGWAAMHAVKVGLTPVVLGMSAATLAFYAGLAAAVVALGTLVVRAAWPASWDAKCQNAVNTRSATANAHAQQVAADAVEKTTSSAQQAEGKVSDAANKAGDALDKGKARAEAKGEEIAQTIQEHSEAAEQKAA